MQGKERSKEPSAEAEERGDRRDRKGGKGRKWEEEQEGSAAPSKPVSLFDFLEEKIPAGRQLAKLI